MTTTSAVDDLDPSTIRLTRAAGSPASMVLAALPVRAWQPPLPLPDPPTDLGECAHGGTDVLARQLIASLVEAIAGRRPTQQLRAWVSAGVYELASELARSGACTGIGVRSIRLQAPVATTIEAAIHLNIGRHSRAAAVQLTYTDHRWQITRMEVALRRSGTPVTDLELLARATRTRRVATDSGVGVVAGGLALSTDLTALVGG